MLRCIFLNIAALERFKVSQFVRFTSFFFPTPLFQKLSLIQTRVRKFLFCTVPRHNLIFSLVFSGYWGYFLRGSN